MPSSVNLRTTMYEQVTKKYISQVGAKITTSYIATTLKHGSDVARVVASAQLWGF